MPKAITESELEEMVLEHFEKLGYELVYGPDIAPAPEGKSPERDNYSQVVLVKRLEEAVRRLNPSLPDEARREALKRVVRNESHDLVENNRNFHRMLSDGVSVEYRGKDGSEKSGIVRLFDFDDPKKNEFLAVNQFTIIEERNNRRPDVLVFVNGLPLAAIELKNPAEEKADIWAAFGQFETYKMQIPSLFRFNELLIISDGLGARAGTITSSKERFLPWKETHGVSFPKNTPEIEILLSGMFDKSRFLDIVRHFIVFEEERNAKEGAARLSKKLAAYHQFNAVNKAIESTVKASEGDRRAGVVWHTQGSGKSLTMVFYSCKLVLGLDNPTIIVLTDRNDLDDQLFGTFSRCHDLLRQKPIQAESRDELKKHLKVASGGIVFTTIQKFLPEEKGGKYPLLSERKNIVVIADEAHRSQYDFIDGFARHMRDALPNASFIGFTGTPIEKADRNTRHVFGKDVDVYDINQSVSDGMTVRIYYESRLAKLELKPEERPKIDKDFEEVTEGEESESKEKLKTKWARLEKIVGSKERIKRVANDIVEHFENRLSVINGKGMIVCMSRRICIDLYNEIIRLRPQWKEKDDAKGFLKVVMTGSASDPAEWQEHIRNKIRRREIGDTFKDPSSPIKLVIVRDMWLTGFDVPSLHTMYVDKPMRGHGLMQAIARVNRVFKDKPGGLIVDYLGLAYELKKALAEYTESGGKGKPTIDQEDAVALMIEKYEVVKTMFHGFDYRKFFSMQPKERMPFILQALDFVLKQDDGKKRFVKHVAEMSRAFALSVPNAKAMELRDEVGFFQAVKAAIVKNTAPSGDEAENLDSAINQIISKAIVSDRVIDIFEAAGIKKPDVSILSPEFLLEIKEMPQKNLAFEMLKKLLNDEIKFREKKNLVQGRSFKEMLEKAIKAYTNKSIETAEVIDELINLAKEMRETDKRGEKLKLTSEEIAFYDALETNDSAVKVLGDETLREIARELVDTVRKNATIDWTIRESVQAGLRIMIKRVLRKFNYPPDKQQKATDTVLLQATLLCKDWTGNGHDQNS